MRYSFAPLEPDAVAFLSQRTGIDYSHSDFSRPEWLCITARRHDAVVGVLVFEFKEWFDAHLSTAVSDRRAVTRRLLRVAFQTVFSRAVRITALVAPDNPTAIGEARRLGFRYEGFLRMAVEGRRDALIFGMLKNECRFLPGWQRPHGLWQFPAPPVGGFHGQHA